MNKFTLIAPLLVALTMSNSAQASQFVQNGNFASLTNGLGELGNNTDATGWSMSGYNRVMNIADVGSSGQYGALTLWDQANGGSNSWNGQSPTGDNFVALDGDFETGPLTQMIDGLTAGQAYNLTFSYAYSQQNGFNGPTNQNMLVSFGNTTFTTSPAATPYTLANHGFSGWNTYSGTVTATGPSELLSFLAQSDTPVPPFALLTDVSLSAVPEPATWAMMILGLGAMGVTARRRRSALAFA
jgi:hypothetical protein